MEEIREMRSYLEEDEIELTELTESVLRKLEGINDEEYDLLDLIPEFDE